MALHKVNVSTVADAPVTEEGSEGARIRWLISEKDGAPTFLMRHFTVKAGGFTPIITTTGSMKSTSLKGKARFDTRVERRESSPETPS